MTLELESQVIRSYLQSGSEASEQEIRGGECTVFAYPEQVGIGKQIVSYCNCCSTKYPSALEDPQTIGSHQDCECLLPGVSIAIVIWDGGIELVSR